MSDVIVIGAGPAGCAAAMLLARRGARVTLIEQHRFPRDKVCGECLSALGIEVLKRLSAVNRIEGLLPVELTRTAVHTVDGKSVRVPLPRPMWGISRVAFDSALLENAREAGAVVRQPARCERIELSPRPAVRVRDLWSNEVRLLRADRVIVADGKGSLVPGAAPRTEDFGIKAHFVDVAGPRDTIELFGCRGLYGGVAAIEGGRWNVAFSVPAERLRRHRGDVAAVFEEITRENPVLREHMRTAKRCGDWVVSPLPRFGVRRSWPAGLIPVGNAAAAIEPIGGEGMGLALRSAELAAEVLIAELLAGDTPALSLSRYSEGSQGGGLPRGRLIYRPNQRRNSPLPNPPSGCRGSKKLYGVFASLWEMRAAACRAGAIITSRPALAGALVPLLKRRMVAHAVFRLTGKK